MFRHFRSLLVISLLLVICWGCGLRLKGYESFDYLKGGAGKDFPRKVLWLKLKNQGPYEIDQLNLLEGGILKGLRSNKALELVEYPELSEASIAFDERNTKYHYPSHLKEKAMTDGVFSAIQVTLLAPTVDVRRSGIWPLRKTKMFVGVNARIMSLDLTTDTVLINKVEKEEVAFYYDPIAEEDPSLYQEALEKATKALTKGIVASIAEVIKDTPWVTFVTRVQGDTVEIPVGKRHGLKEGNEFAVYEKADVIKAFDGRTYPIWGKRVGTLKVREMGDTKSILTLISGSGISEGQLIKLLR